jgi:hypothetical protein
MIRWFIPVRERPRRCTAGGRFVNPTIDESEYARGSERHAEPLSTTPDYTPPRRTTMTIRKKPSAAEMLTRQLNSTKWKHADTINDEFAH